MVFVVFVALVFVATGALAAVAHFGEFPETVAASAVPVQYQKAFQA